MARMRVVTGGKNFPALTEGEAGGPPKHRTNNLAAVWKNLSEGYHRDQTKRYTRLCEYYDLTPSRNNSCRDHENSSVESEQKQAAEEHYLNHGHYLAIALHG